MSETMVQLGTLGNFIRGKGIAKSDLVEQGGISCIRYAELYTEYSEVIRSPISRASNEVAANAKKLEYGDLIFPSSGETAEEIGKASAFVGQTETYVGGDTIILRGHGQDPVYLAHALNSWEVNKQKFSLATGNSVVHIYAQELSQLSLWLPNLHEQQKIVEILIDCDTAIEKIENKKQSLLKVEKHYETLLLNKPIINNEWTGDLLSQVMVKREEVSTYSNQYEVYTSSRRGIFKQSEYFSKQVASENNTGYGIIRYGDFTYRAMTDDDIFAFNFFEAEVGIVSPAYSVFSIKNCDDIFFRRLLNCSRFAYELKKVAQGGTRKSLKFSSLTSIKINLPDYSAQQKIGTLFGQLEMEGVKLSKQIDLFKKQKRGLMQQLLTGKLRIKGGSMSDIKLFTITGQAVTEMTGAAMTLEKPLQTLFEGNLDALIGVRFLASEYTITDGRIDTLGLDENNCPVIIEYKRHSNENIINQGLFYLDWLMDHQADFKLLVMEKIGKDAAAAIDWSAPRLVCVAADFTRYDVHAVKQMNRNIELIRYRKFGDDLLMLDLLTATTNTMPATPSNGGGRSTQRDHENILAASSGAQKVRYDALVDYLHSLGDDVQERHLKRYVAFKRIKNFACVELRNQKSHIMVFVQADLDQIELVDGFSRDVSDIGHYGTGNIEITIASDADLECAKSLIQQSYEVS